MIYVIGSLRSPQIPHIGNKLRDAGYEVFDDWFSAGEEADDKLWAYEQLRGHNYREALQGYAAKHIFEFDKTHIDRCEAAVLVMKAGRSAHLELGYVLGQGKPGFILFDEEPPRIDLMYQFATGIAYNVEELVMMLDRAKLSKPRPLSRYDRMLRWLHEGMQHWWRFQ